MENPKVDSITFVLKANCTCDGCKDKFRQVKKNNGGVHSISIDAERGRATITGTAGPYQVVDELRKFGKSVKLLSIEGPTSPKHSKHRSAPQRPIQKVAPTPQVHDKSTVKKTSHCCCSAHKLKLIEGHIKRFTCNRCKVDGFRSRYRCEICPYEIHQECKNPKPITSPTYFHGLTFTYRDKPPPRLRSRSDPGGHNKLSCAACGEFILGHFYSSGDMENAMYLHPSCSNLRLCENIGGTEFVLQYRPSERCMWCESDKDARCKVAGWVYMSRCKTYRLHVNCIKKLVHQAWLKGVVSDTKDAWASVESLDLELEAKLKRKRGKGFNFWRPVGLLIKAVVGVLFGDVTGIVPMVVAIVEVLSKYN